MKILLVCQYFWPESFRVNDLAIELKQRGFEVSVLTGKPNYPQGKFYHGYGFFSKIKDIYKGINIYRVPIISRGNGKGIRLFLNYLSFVIFGCFFVLFHRKKYDVVLTYGLSPIIQAYPAILYKKLHRVKTLLWVQDLWPESVSAAGNVNSKFVLKPLFRVVKHIYKNTNQILVQSTSFIPSIKEKGVLEDKLYYMPNWAEDLYSDVSRVNKERYIDIIPNGFVVMFAGNIGEAQDFECIIKAVEKTKNIPDIKWVIVGDGRKRQWVENKIEQLELQDTVKLLGRYPLEDMPDLFTHADIMLLTLKDEEIFSMTIPSKLQSYMAFGKPVAGMLNGIGARIIVDSKCGYVTGASDSVTLANNIIEAYSNKKEDLVEKGLNGKKYYNEFFSKKQIIDKLLIIFKK